MEGLISESYISDIHDSTLGYSYVMISALLNCSYGPVNDVIDLAEKNSVR